MSRNVIGTCMRRAHVGLVQRCRQGGIFQGRRCCQLALAEQTAGHATARQQFDGGMRFTLTLKFGDERALKSARECGQGREVVADLSEQRFPWHSRPFRSGIAARTCTPPLRTASMVGIYLRLESGLWERRTAAEHVAIEATRDEMTRAVTAITCSQAN